MSAYTTSTYDVGEQQRKSLSAIKESIVGEKKVSVLIVDDNEDDAEMTQVKLSKRGVKSTIASTAQDAIEWIKRNGFWIVFLDWKLVGMSGLELLTRINDMSPKHQVIVLTGAKDSDLVASDALKAGAIAVMSKPLSDETIQIVFGSPPSV